MAAYNVSYLIREDIKDLTASEREEFHPYAVRVSAPNATRAQSKVVNELKDVEAIKTKNDVIIVEVKVVA